MYLKSIEVYGFKSFANKITFEFKNGITGIVGPNGSGKSNVADAVRWVLGEQSAKQLRGAKMEDVIFSGTESRKPLGSAYVAITLDNSDHSLPIEYDQVTVARRVYRSGESEYLVNGSPCRLKDVQALFFDTGIGKEGYSIIGQGQIDRILSGKPEERRELFDEAAGIVKYKKNKAATEKTLEAEKQNLYRVNDILSELEVQVGPLKQQSEVAREYLVCRDTLKDLDINIFLLESCHYKELKEQLDHKLQITLGDIKDSGYNFEKIKEEYQKLELKLEEVNLQIDTAKNDVNEQRLQKEKLEGEIRVLKEQIRTALNNDQHVKSNISRISQDMELKAAEIAKIDIQKKELYETLSIAEQHKKKLEEESLSKQSNILDYTKQIELNKAKIIDFMNASASLKTKVQRYDTMLEQIELRRSELNQRLLQNKSDEMKQLDVREILMSEQDQLSADANLLNQDLQENETKLLNNNEKNKANVAAMSNCQQEYHRARSKLEALKNMTERYEGYGNSIKRVMEKKKEYPGIHGVVADIIKVKKEYEVAVETALGGSIQNIVTDSEYTAKAMIEHLKRNKYGRATFLPLTSITNKSGFYNEKALLEKGVIGLASELVDTEDQYQVLAQYLLGRIVVVDNMDNAIVLAKKYKYSMRIVTIEGESLNPGGAMTGGAFKNNSNLLGRRRELEEIELMMKQQLMLIESAQNLELTLKKEKDVLRGVRDQLTTRQQELSLALNTNKIGLSQVEGKQKEISQLMASLKREVQELNQQVVEIKESKNSLEMDTNDQDLGKTSCEQDILALEVKLTQCQQDMVILTKELTEANIEYAAVKQQSDFLLINLKRVVGEQQKLTQELEALHGNNQDVEEQVRLIHEKEEQVCVKIKDYEIFIKEKLEISSQLETQKNEITAIHKDFFQKREELSERISNLDKEQFRLVGQKEKVEEQENHLSQYMWEEYEITYHQALSMKGDNEYTDLSQMKKSSADIKTSMKNMGVVNINAIEDYKNVSERYEFLLGQRDDLLEAEENLMQIIAQLDTAMRAQFSEKFEEIQIMFNKVFCDLFGGGKASLQLMEDQDILEAGIRIVSQPPGKKLQNMMQLSGGEKALTAIALLFAIQRLKPSPFCLLDEIEAALDDSNVDRFAKYLHKLIKDTQFIVITHRRGTMVAADVLYGITMQEKGVSTLVSVNLIENQLEQ